MKRQITVAILVFMVMMTSIPVNAAAVDGKQQPIPLELTKMVYSDDTARPISIEITDKDPVVWGNYRGKIYEFTPPQPGTLILRVSPFKGSRGTELILSDSEDFSKDSAGNWDTIYEWSSSDDRTNTFMKYGGTGEKFYLAIVNDANSFSSQAQLQAEFYAREMEKTVELGKEYVFTGDGLFEDIKFTADKSGYIAVDLHLAGNSASVSLRDQTYEPISDFYGTKCNSKYPGYFGVQKGKTYYLRLFPRRLPEYGPYRIWTQAHEVKEKSGASRKKAVLVKKNKTVKGYILPGKKTSDWYKIKVTKKKNVKFTVKNMFSDQCYFDIYNKKGKKLKTKQKVMTSDTDVLSKTRTVRLAKGTYYIKVYNKTKGDSGGYTLKWK